MADKLILCKQPDISEKESKVFRRLCKMALLLALKEQSVLDDSTIQTSLEILEKEN